MMPLPRLEGTNIVLRRFKRTDVAAIRGYANDPEVAHYLPMMPHPYTLEDARLWVNMAHRYERAGSGYQFAIELRGSGEIIGGIGLKNVNRDDQNVEVGYCIARPFWNKGHASEAMRLILSFAFGRLDMMRVYAVVDATNVPSVRVLEKARFVREGTWRKARREGNRWHDVYAYGLLREEWGAAGSP